MKKFLASGFFLLLSVLLFAQGESKTVTFDDGTTMELSNFSCDNYVYPTLQLSAGLSGGTRPLQTVDILLPLQLNYVLSKIQINARADIPILKDFDEQYYFLARDRELVTINNYKVFRMMEASVGFFLLDKEVLKDLSIQVKSVRGSRTTTNYNVAMTLPVRYKAGPRIGFFSYRSLINNYFLDNDSLVAEDKQTLAYMKPSKINSPDLKNIYMTNFSSNSFYIGFEFGKIVNLHFMRDEKSVTRQEKQSIYADFFVTGDINMEDMIVVDSLEGGTHNYDVLHDGPGGFQYRRTGFRVGYELIFGLTKQSAVTFQVEGGIRPGIANLVNDNSPAPLGRKLYAFGRVMYTWGTGL